MKPSIGATAALLLLATCDQAEPDRSSANIESASQALGKPAASEVAIWQRVGGSNLPDGRYLQAVAFDETRKVAVMFGGMVYTPNSGVATPNQEMWEWNPATGEWTNRTGTGAQPAVRSGSAMVFDSKRNKIVLFGGRAGSGFNYQDTWEWDPLGGTWTDVTSSGGRPRARSQHAMVYEKSTGLILLFGGGRSDSTSSDGSGISVSFADTWEWDATNHTWTQRQPTDSPAARHDLGLVWDSSRNKAVLFGGMEKDTAGVDGTPTQDTWEWDPTAGTWTERTTQGGKPSPRYAHAMAFAGGINKAIVFGGWDITTGGSMNDLWEWDPTAGSWTLRLDGTQSDIPSVRMYASLVSNDSAARLELIAGAADDPYGMGVVGPSGYSWLPSREVWEINTATYACQDRSTPSNTPLPRTNHALAYNPSTAKTYVFGGMDMNQQAFDDLWEWDGKTWAEVAADVRPPARSDAGLAYDPVRKSLILYGGQTYQMGGMYYQTVLGDTWEWNSTTRQWTELFPKTSPDPLWGHGMVTDTTRNKILLFAGMSDYSYYPIRPAPGYPSPYKNPVRNDVWEWDGNNLTWTNRTPVIPATAPSPRQYPILAYDEARQKLFVGESSGYYVGGGYSPFWEWDPVSGGWAVYDTGDNLAYGSPAYAAYDSNRRREVLFGDMWSMTTGIHETWELAAKGPTWYVRAIDNSPQSGSGSAMAFDRARGVVVLFGGNGNGYPSDETWEYSVTGLGNGEGCTTSTASACASGNCVDGVCCDTKSCTGPCKSCSVSGHEGTCFVAQAGTEVPGSCSSGQACDGSGNCKASSGQTCSSASTCASGFCVDGVCCNSACNGTCVSCNQAGLAGKCSPYPFGNDPEKECSKGSGTCKSACDGVGSCVYPAYGSTCGNCMLCDGGGNCSMSDPFCNLGTGGSSGYGGISGRGGSSGYGGITARGGSSGYGGSYGTGGSVVYGGSYASGGTISFAGSSARGGSSGFAGSYASGGTISAGGSYASGGTTSAGGSTASGGSTSLGGSAASGGSTSLGGSAASGGTSVGSSGVGGSGGASSLAGSGGNRDGGAGTSSGARPDAQGDNAMGTTQLHHAGCNCTVGRTASPGLGTPIFLAGFALLLRRIRRPRR